MGLILENKLGKDDIKVVMEVIKGEVKETGMSEVKIDNQYVRVFLIDSYGWVRYKTYDEKGEYVTKKIREGVFTAKFIEENIELVEYILHKEGLWEISLFD